MKKFKKSKKVMYSVFLAIFLNILPRIANLLLKKKKIQNKNKSLASQNGR